MSEKTNPNDSRLKQRSRFTNGAVAKVNAIPLPIEFPDSLPVSGERPVIEKALQDHQVIVVCGETGSGKTTQLPKIALNMGRGRANGGGLIGHTQPRRIAASSVAKRIAEELKTPLGEIAGYKVRFQDRLQPGASIKLMTDGILLAETQTDPLLKAYDTLIIDEAHERSLNIDFLLGYLKKILPYRPDLKIIVTSATIDANRFAQHFASAKGPAPVIMVSGRTFPVEQRWRPFEESKDLDINDAIADAVDELWREGPGDVLVFLSGEREIREAADALHKRWSANKQGWTPDILPLFARLSQQEQDRVFHVGNGRRIVLATNVAETSLTVPGIRYVVDTGYARVKRYSYRNKVEQLQIEPISQAAANQRAGRCGRVSNGICIRLYDEKDFAGRPRFTDPEILRSSLAGVILRMKSLGLGLVEEFPFLEEPPRKAIADGYALLAELGAVDENNELTEMGQALSKLPLDPRVGRMLIEAKQRHALSEVLIIAAALSGQDVRDRPMEQQQAADEKHKQFDDERSEFMGYLKLWRWIEAGRGVHGHPHAANQQADQHKLSHRRQEQRLRESFVSPRRVREWRDVHSQLHTVIAEQGWRLNGSDATYEQIHLSMLSGLLGNIGCKADDDEWYLGARGIKFWKHPGAHLSKKPGRWIMAAELVDTTRLFGRGIAAIDPQWIPPLAGHLLKTQLLEPHWEKKAAEVIALERATLYGLVIYSGRRVNFSRVDLKQAREIFIREALVQGEWESRWPFLAHNRKVMSQVQDLEHKSRRQDVLIDDEMIYAYYDEHLPEDVCSGATFDRWYRHVQGTDNKLLFMTREELMRHDASSVTHAAFPRAIRLGGVDCSVTYLHDPGDAKDGVTVTVPIYVLNQVSEERCEWLVPGMLQAKVVALCKSLPPRPRSRLVPIPEFAAEFCELHEFGQGALLDILLGAVKERTQLAIQRQDFKLDQLAPHLFMNFRVIDEHGRQLGAGRQLSNLKSELGVQARTAFQALAALKIKGTPHTDTGKEVAREVKPNHNAPASADASPPQINSPANAATTSTSYTHWGFGELPELLEVKKGGQSMIGFPAIVDQATHVTIEVFDEPELAALKHRDGLRRLSALQLKEPLKYLEKNIPDFTRLAVAYMPLGTEQELKQSIIDLTLDRALLQEPLPHHAASFEQRIQEGRSRINLIAQEVARLASQILTEFSAASRKLKDTKVDKETQEDIQQQLQRLCHRRFLNDTPWVQLQHLPRYLKAITLRLDKWRADPQKDKSKLSELRPLLQRLDRRLQELKGKNDPRLNDYRWLLEELRVSFFAQELRTPQPVSTKRLDKVWSQIIS